MNPTNDHVPFGRPGIEPRWTHSTKEGIGTAYHTSCRVWFTLSHGIVNELYYPYIDQPNTRDLEFLITDGETFCHEEKRDLSYHIEYPEQNVLLYRLINTEPTGRYQIRKEVLTDPHASVFLMHTRLEILDPTLRGKLRLFALLAPHLKRGGRNNSAAWCTMAGRKLIHAHRQDMHLVFGCDPDFARRSVGYVGMSDGWQDLMDNFTMDWEFDTAEAGNIALIGEIDWRHTLEFTVGVSFGRSQQSATAKLLQSLAEPFEKHRETYVVQWRRTEIGCHDFEEHTADGGHLVRLSRCILLAHEDKVFQGALIASMSIPWGEIRGDDDLGGYHLVWVRDMVQSAIALLATGQKHTPLRALIWLACLQDHDGGFPQNSWIDGSKYWQGIQLDEVAAPIILAWHLRRAQALTSFDPWILVSRAARYLMANGPVTQQDRWEENSGYSASTLAAIVASLVCAAQFALDRADQSCATFLYDYADWLAAHIEAWTVTDCGELVPEKPRHHIRINPTDPTFPDPHADPDTGTIAITNGGGMWPARNVVSGDFLQLVRLGIRDPQDPLVRDSLEVIDRVLKHDLPQGPSWRRYNHDGYGQKEDGSAYDGTGVGRCWPILTGERGHYELAAGRDPLPLIIAMEKFANEGGMLPEQVWDGADLGKMTRGSPTGAAMPLCWAHAEYLTLVRSRHDGVCFDRIEAAHQRYVEHKVQSSLEIWTLRHRLRHIKGGKTLRIITQAPALVHWSVDGWQTTQDSETHDTGLGLCFIALSTDALPSDTRVSFTFYWTERHQWEGADFEVVIQ
jgi:glucoamylase